LVRRAAIGFSVVGSSMRSGVPFYGKASRNAF